MNRKEFLSKLSVGAAFALTTGCLGSCSKDNGSIAPSGNVDFTLDLNAATNSNLQSNGGYVINNRVVVAKDSSGNYIAATQRCSHEGLKEVILRNDEWYCTAHGARFDLQGGGLNSDGGKGLTIYKTELNGTMLRVFL
jgi:nitrite reductase/ring-hydroxylating ferredoxin subunit